MKSSAKKVELASVDDLFSTEESRADAQREKIVEIPLSELHPFKGHPFKVKDDEAMMETADSIKQYGVLVPAIARPDPEGGYELVAGHRRHRASELAEKETMPVIVRDLDDDAATIIMVDSNLQRESLLPSERAFAYKMKLEAMKHQGERVDLTCAQVGHKSDGRKSRDILAEQVGQSKNQIQRFIRLTELISELLDMVDEKKIALNPAYELSFLKKEEQRDLLDAMDSEQAIAATGRVRGADDVIAYHVRQSFCPGEIAPEEANRLGVEFAKRFTKGKHAFIVCTHIDKAHVHNHIIWSSVNLDCDRKFRNFWGSTKAVRHLSDTICIENGLSIVENPKPHGKSYNKWLGDQAKPSHRELLRAAIDNALAQKPADLDELLKLLQKSGCEVSKRGKAYRLKLPGWSKVSRLDSLGDGYTLEDLLAVLAGQKVHTPRQKPVKRADLPKVNLLVDIQAKLQAGKGAGYARWAKVFNLKQMAQTVNYLTEHNLLEYAVLEEKAAAATAHHNELSARIKAAEKRIAEIAVLRTHIINYAKTRDTYVAYRKAGYSKKFREEHEEEILLHQAAKNAFDDMGVKKLPKVKELQADYGRLLEEKKKTYTEYRRSREEMRELLAAKANVDRLLNMEMAYDMEKEKGHDQR